MAVLSVHDRAYPDDPYTQWRLAEIAAELAELRLGKPRRLPLFPEDAAEQLRLIAEEPCDWEEALGQ